MKKNLTGLTFLVIILGLLGCGKGTDTKPVYKFTAKVNTTSWATDMVEPSSTPTEANYVSSLYYYTADKSINVTVRNPKNNQRLTFTIYLTSIANAVGTYTISSGKFYPYFYIATNDYLDDLTNSGQFEITKFSYDLNSGKITSFSGKFSFTQQAEHADGNIRTTNVTEGEVNNLIEQ